MSTLRKWPKSKSCFLKTFLYLALESTNLIGARILTDIIISCFKNNTHFTAIIVLNIISECITWRRAFSCHFTAIHKSHEARGGDITWTLCASGVIREAVMVSWDLMSSGLERRWIRTYSPRWRKSWMPVTSVCWWDRASMFKPINVLYSPKSLDECQVCC